MVDLALLQSVSYIAGALGVCVAAAYYVMNLRTTQKNLKTTLETRKIQLITNLSHEIFNEEGFHKFGELLNMEWRDYDDFEKKKYGSDVNLDNYSKRMSTLYIFNSAGSLPREKLVEPETLYGLDMM
jgi:hypothetical protein